MNANIQHAREVALGILQPTPAQLERGMELHRIVLSHTDPKVYPINPFFLPARLAVQQGGFLIPLDIRQPFMHNLLAMPRDPQGANGHRDFRHRVLLVRLHFCPSELEEVRYKLLRMNINNAALFPGLDGYSQGLRDILPFKEQRYSLRKGF